MFMQLRADCSKLLFERSVGSDAFDESRSAPVGQSPAALTRAIQHQVKSSVLLLLIAKRDEQTVVPLGSSCRASGQRLDVDDCGATTLFAKNSQIENWHTAEI